MVPAAPSAGTARRTLGRKKGVKRNCKGWRKRKAYPREIRMYRVVIKQLQLSFLSVLAISHSFLTSTVLFDFFFLSFSFYLPLPIVPSLIRFLSLFLFPLLSSFWTLSRCACGNFPGVIFAALLARSLTSLSSVYPRRHFSRPPLPPSPCPLLPRYPVHIPVRFRASRFHGRPRRRSATSFHSVRRLRFLFHFRFYRVTSPGYFVPDGDGGRSFFHGPAGKNN